MLALKWFGGFGGWVLGDETVKFSVNFLVFDRGLINVMTPPALPGFCTCKCRSSFEPGFTVSCEVDVWPG